MLTQSFQILCICPFSKIITILSRKMLSFSFIFSMLLLTGIHAFQKSNNLVGRMSSLRMASSFYELAEKVIKRILAILTI